MEPPDGFYGSKEADGTWNGAMGMLLRGEVDVLYTGMAITPARMEVMQFTQPYYQSGI